MKYSDTATSRNVTNTYLVDSSKEGSNSNEKMLMLLLSCVMVLANPLSAFVNNVNEEISPAF